MHIRQLSANQFRNYESLFLEFAQGINCVYGKNGAGKTNILDALHYLSFTRGYRGGSDRNAVQEGNTFFMTAGKIEKEGHIIDFQCNFVQGKGKKILLNNKPLKKMSEHIGRIPMVAIFPQDAELITGASILRRKFVDLLISQYDPAYLHHLIQYERILAQRNAQLKLFAEHRMFDAEQLELWDSQLIPHGIYIHEGRQKFLTSFLPIFISYFRLVISENELPDIRYRSHVEENTYTGWEQLLLRYRERDLVNQYSSAGIHRDDLVFTINDQAVRNFSSQGQQKTFIISLKLAQYQLLADQVGIAPILLLDDIFDKLDEQRLTHIAQLLLEDIPGQVFITDTSFERLKIVFGKGGTRETAYFHVEAGNVSRRSGE